MLMSSLLAPISYQVKEASSKSCELLLQAGYIRQTSAGIYAWLPLGLCVLSNISGIIDRHIQDIGYQKVLFPTVQEARLWKQSGRYGDYGDELLRFKDRRGRELLYGPTAEEIITDIVGRSIQSAKDLPRCIYQIQWKFRDELRPRFGLIRCREFLMKDGYSFDVSAERMEYSFYSNFRAYWSIFRYLELDAMPVRADSGPIGGKLSYEFVVPHHTGETDILYAPSTLPENLTGQEDVWEFKRIWENSYVVNAQLSDGGAGHGDAQNTAHTAGCTEHGDAQNTANTAGCTGHGDAQNTANITEGTGHGDAQNTANTAGCTGHGDAQNTANITEGIGHGDAQNTANTAGCTGHGDAQNTANTAGCTGHGDAQNTAHTAGCTEHGDAQNTANTAGCTEHGDAQNTANTAGCTGHGDAQNTANTAGCTEHGDAQNTANTAGCTEHGDAQNTAPSKAPAGVEVISSKGIEIGHIFSFGNKYSQPMGLAVQGEHVYMGSYGIGVSRLVSVIADVKSDQDGLAWPMSVAPYKVHVLAIGGKESEAIASKLYKVLLQVTEVLYDDRGLSPGKAFKDMDLLGMPWQVIVSLRNGKVYEVRNRKDKENVMMMSLEQVVDFFAHLTGTVQTRCNSI